MTFEQAAAFVEDALVRIQTQCESVADREAALAWLLGLFPSATVAAIADVRGFHDLARRARRLPREAA